MRLVLLIIYSNCGVYESLCISLEPKSSSRLLQMVSAVLAIFCTVFTDAAIATPIVFMDEQGISFRLYESVFSRTI